MEFEILSQLTTLNKYIQAERSNRFVAAKLKRENTEAVGWQLLEQKIKPINRKCNFDFTWYCKNQKEDPDNISFAQKFVFDALVNQNILPSDGWKYVGRITHNFEVRDLPGVKVKII